MRQIDAPSVSDKSRSARIPIPDLDSEVAWRVKNESGWGQHQCRGHAGGYFPPTRCRLHSVLDSKQARAGWQTCPDRKSRASSVRWYGYLPTPKSNLRRPPLSPSLTGPSSSTGIGSLAPGASTWKITSCSMMNPKFRSIFDSMRSSLRN